MMKAGDLLKAVGEFRDGFLVTAGVFYFFGYIVWGIHAYRNEMGLLPALDFQYFVAGIPTVLVLFGLWGIFVVFRKLKQAIRIWIGESPTGAKLFLCWVMVGLGAIAIFLIMAHDSEWFEAVFPGLRHSNSFVIFLGFLVIVSALFLPPKGSVAAHRNSYDGGLRELVNALSSIPVAFIRALSWIYAPLFMVGLAALAFIYVLEIYPIIPQEFGGARPRSVFLDIVKSELSSDTFEEIIPPSADNTGGPVMRSQKVEVLFSGGDVLLVRSERGKVYEIIKNAVKAVIPV
ncbi:MAG: hypothetical protein HYW57_09625, partial [Ignavibacteriales bacterium]|nr:hypothetical protein [Ignavibacteriales bacterium]